MDEQNKNQIEPAIGDKLFKNRVILITDEISRESFSAFLKQLIAMDCESNDPITVYVNSPGGDAYTGLAFYDSLRFVKSPITIIGAGLVASAAALLYLAVPRERRLSLPGTRYLIHQPLLQGSDNSPFLTSIQIDIEAEEMENLRKRLDSIIADATGMSIEDTTKATERDNWLSAEDAMSIGIVGRIIANISEK